MKKFFAAALAALMLLSCTAGSKPKVLSKFTDMARLRHDMR